MRKLIILLILMTSILAQNSFLGEATITDLNDINRLKININKGYVHVIGWEKQEISIRGYEKQRFDNDKKVSFFLKKSSETLQLVQEDIEGFSSYNIFVPYHLDLYITINEKGLIRVRKSAGEIVANSTTADIRLNELSGSAIVNSQTGAIYVDLKQLNSDQNLAFSNGYGNISLSLPIDAKATFQISTISGDVYSDHKMTIHSTTSEVSKTIESDYLPLNKGRIKTQLNGGGSIIPIHTLSGHIYIEKLIQTTKGINHADN